MPRQPRALSTTGFYHVTARGNAKGIIFECDEHRLKFLDLLDRYRGEFGFRVIAWCLMNNHVHLVVDALEVDLSAAMHALMSAYASYFNEREDRVGHVFQSPFRSKPIESDAQLVNTVRYVHLNPQRAGICEASQYRWSSHNEYCSTPLLVNPEPVFAAAGGRAHFLDWSLDPYSVVMLPGSRKTLADEKVASIARRELSIGESVPLGEAEATARNKALASLNFRGVTIKQLARVFGMGARSVSRVLSAERARAMRSRGHVGETLSARRVLVVPYREDWPRLFETEKPVLVEALGDRLRAIHHVGSTAVEGLESRPTIDVLAVVDSLEDFGTERSRLCDAGYAWKGDYGMPNRRRLVKNDGSREVMHLHVFAETSEQDITRHLAMRDYLREHPDVAEAYGELKKRLANDCPYDVEGYCDAKSGFVRQLEAEALAWRIGACSEYAK